MPTTARSIHHPNGLYIFNPCHLSGGGGVMGEERGSNSPTSAAAQRGETVDSWAPSSSPHRSRGLSALAVAPCCCAPPLSPHIPQQPAPPLASRTRPPHPNPACLTHLLLTLLCVPGLWGRRLPLHHQSHDHPHGKLQLPCLRLRGALPDPRAAGEWSVRLLSIFC